MSKPEPVSRIALMSQIVATVDAAAIPGMRPRRTSLDHDVHFGSMFFSWDRAWTVGVDLNVDIDALGGPRVQVNWPSTHRSPAAARAAVALYSAVTDLACLLEAQLSGVVVEAP